MGRAHDRRSWKKSVKGEAGRATDRREEKKSRGKKRGEETPPSRLSMPGFSAPFTGSPRRRRRRKGGTCLREGEKDPHTLSSPRRAEQLERKEEKKKKGGPEKKKKYEVTPTRKDPSTYEGMKKKTGTGATAPSPPFPSPFLSYCRRKKSRKRRIQSLLLFIGVGENVRNGKKKTHP